MKKEIKLLDFKSHEQLGKKLQSIQMDLHHIKNTLTYSHGEGNLSEDANEAMLTVTELMRELERVAKLDFPNRKNVDKLYRNSSLIIYARSKNKK
ncbi:MAG: hypothetical protein KAS32_16695 [Candidatus Peribacteraceae bacterium]|nr:hypothetical protein [Candidatus Peribacteraceae bacterium]